MTRRPWRARQFAVWPLRLIHTFFRRVTIDGAELLAKTGPVIVVANHGNGLVDGMLLISMLPRWPRFVGKAALFDIAPAKAVVEGGRGDSGLPAPRMPNLVGPTALLRTTRRLPDAGGCSAKAQWWQYFRTG